LPQPGWRDSLDPMAGCSRAQASQCRDIDPGSRCPVLERICDALLVALCSASSHRAAAEVRNEELLLVENVESAISLGAQCVLVPECKRSPVMGQTQALSRTVRVRPSPSPIAGSLSSTEAWRPARGRSDFQTLVVFRALRLGPSCAVGAIPVGPLGLPLSDITSRRNPRLTSVSWLGRATAARSRLMTRQIREVAPSVFPVASVPRGETLRSLRLMTVSRLRCALGSTDGPAKLRG